MADGFIVRKGGVAVELTAAPSLTLVSKTETQIVFTITNNDTETVDIFWEVDDTTPDANTLSLAGGATSSNQTASGLTQNTQFVIHAFANAAGKAGSQTVTLTVTTDAVIYTAATGGTTAEYDDGGKRYKSHTFTSDSNFLVSTAGNGDRNKVDCLIIAGGAGDVGGYSGGGGAGGYITTNGTSGGGASSEPKVVVTAQAYSIDVASGGAADSNGDNSSALGITATGGGKGGDAGNSGFNGGSGGGGSFLGPNGGTGTSGQGTNGGIGSTSFLQNRAATGGGGGAGVVGSNAPSMDTAGNGGNGLSNTLRTGSSETRGGGGGGAIGPSSIGSPGTGGSGGGANGVKGTTAGLSGTANTGGGAGGTVNGSKGSGGSGIVIIRYEIAPSV